MYILQRSTYLASCNREAQNYFWSSVSVPGRFLNFENLGISLSKISESKLRSRFMNQDLNNLTERKLLSGNKINACTSHQNGKYYDAYRKSIEDPESFWTDIGNVATWSKKWDKILDNSDQPFTKWFVGGEINACYNAVDRHVERGMAKKVALIHDSPVTKSIRKVTYEELQQQVSGNLVFY